MRAPPTNLELATAGQDRIYGWPSHRRPVRYVAMPLCSSSPQSILAHQWPLTGMLPFSLRLNWRSCHFGRPSDSLSLNENTLKKVE